MATQAYHNWLAAGEPYQLARWMDDLVNTMEGHGFTVYHYPDIAHLTTSQPQDHTPFSYTGWPIDSPFGWGFGVDIMPKDGNARSLTPLARQIIADKDAGHPALAGLKYINWTDEQGSVWQTSWKPTKATRSNTDKGHIHLSGRSDSAHWRAVDYDPIARMNGEDDMAGIQDVTHALFDNAYVDDTRHRPDASVIGILRQLRNKIDASSVEARAQRTVIEQLAAVITAGGGNVDTIALGAKIDAVRTEIEEVQQQLSAAITRAEAAERERDTLLAAAYAASATPE